MKTAGLTSAFLVKIDPALHHVADVVGGELGLHRGDHLVDLVVGQVDAGELLQRGGGVAEELDFQALIAFELLHNVLNGLFDIYGNPSPLVLALYSTGNSPICQIELAHPARTGYNYNNMF